MRERHGIVLEIVCITVVGYYRFATPIQEVCHVGPMFQGHFVTPGDVEHLNTLFHRDSLPSLPDCGFVPFKYRPESHKIIPDSPGRFRDGVLREIFCYPQYTLVQGFGINRFERPVVIIPPLSMLLW